MDAGAKRILESVTQETLHAHQFSRSSTQATYVLTDLLSRYLALLSSTCAKYAEHAGRHHLNARDAVTALTDLGVDVEELSEYHATEGREMSRYAVHSQRRKEDLLEFNGQCTHAGSAGLLIIPYLSRIFRWASRGQGRFHSPGLCSRNGWSVVGRGGGRGGSLRRDEHGRRVRRDCVA